MHSNKRKKRCWWKKALPFFEWRKCPISTVAGLNEDRRARNFRTVTGSMSMSGPIYATESLSGPSTLYRTSTTTTNRHSSGPIAGTLTPARAIPYLSLRELNMEHPQRISICSSPIYLVT